MSSETTGANRKKKAGLEAGVTGKRLRVVKTVLVVDDDVCFVHQMASALGRLEKQAVATSDPRTAAELARSTRPELAIVDLGMPEMDGLALCYELKKLDAAIFTILFSGSLTTCDSFKAGRSPAVDECREKGNTTAATLLHIAEYGVAPSPESPQLVSLEQAVKNHVTRTLDDAGDNISQAALRLGIKRQSLQRKCRKWQGRMR